MFCRFFQTRSNEVSARQQNEIVRLWWRRQLIRHEIRVWTRDLLIAIGLALIIIIFLYQPVKVEGTSMAPLLSDQERIFINKFVYRFEPIQRGDVVVFWYPLDRSKSFIKRVIALPGESVEIRQGMVYVDGQQIREPYVPPQYEDLSDYGPVRVPPGMFFIENSPLLLDEPPILRSGK